MGFINYFVAGGDIFEGGLGTVVDYDTLTALYDARDANELTVGTVYRVAWSGDDHAPDGQILTRWDGAQLTPNPLTQMEFPTWLIEQSEWSLFVGGGNTSLSFDADGRPMYSVELDSGATSHVWPDPSRYKGVYRFFGGRFRFQNIDDLGASTDRLGPGLFDPEFVTTSENYSLVGFTSSSLTVIWRTTAFSDFGLSFPKTITDDEQVRIFQPWRNSGAGLAAYGAMSFSTGEDTGWGSVSRNVTPDFPQWLVMAPALTAKFASGSGAVGTVATITWQTLDLRQAGSEDDPIGYNTVFP